MSKNNVIIALVVLCLVGIIWGSIQDKKSEGLERQLAAMKEQSHDAVTLPAEENNSAELDAAHAEIEKLKAQNQNLQKDAKVLKGSVSSQQRELASLKKALAESDNSEALRLLQAQRGQRALEIAGLQEKIVAVRAELDEKVKDLAVAEGKAADLEEMKNNLADSIDACSAKSQELSAELEKATVRVGSLEKALEERTKLLVAKGTELSRTKLNMNVLLSKIAAQNNSLAILEETRVALEQELARKFSVIEELQKQLSTQINGDATIEEVSGQNGDAAAEEHAPVH
jgi:chromosome segregation ATPase